jgi:hypothetical protein
MSVTNARLRVTSHLFQARFGSVATDEERLMTAARYHGFEPRARAARRTSGRLALGQAPPRIWPGATTTSRASRTRSARGVP